MDMAGGWQLEFEDGAVMNLDKAEHVREAAGVLSQYCDVLAVRAFPSLTDRQADYEDRIINAFRELRYRAGREPGVSHPPSAAESGGLYDHRTTH